MGGFVGEKRIRLLEAIGKHGSISQAAKTVPFSYKGAWEAVDQMNNLAPEPIVLRSAGGHHGGGTELTAFGRRLVAYYRALEQEYQGALDRLSCGLADDGDLDVARLRQVLKRLSMRSSARNQFAGPIVAIREGNVDSEVTVRLDPELDLTAVVTRESAENLGLTEGREVLAHVKASSILLIVDEDQRISARNRFRGSIASIHEGPVNAEVSLELPGRRHVITAVITAQSVERLGLTVGLPVTAVFKASSVFLLAVD